MTILRLIFSPLQTLLGQWILSKELLQLFAHEVLAEVSYYAPPCSA